MENGFWSSELTDNTPGQEASVAVLNLRAGSSYVPVLRISSDGKVTVRGGSGGWEPLVATPAGAILAET